MSGIHTSIATRNPGAASSAEPLLLPLSGLASIGNKALLEHALSLHGLGNKAACL